MMHYNSIATPATIPRDEGARERSVLSSRRLFGPERTRGAPQPIEGARPCQTLRRSKNQSGTYEAT